MAEHAETGDEAFGIPGGHEARPTATGDAAHEAQQEEHVKVEDLLAMLVHKLLQLVDICGHVLALQHLCQVEGLVDKEAVLRAVKVLIGKEGDRWHHVGMVGHQVHYGSLGPLHRPGDLVHNSFGLAQAANGQKHQHRVHLLGRGRDQLDDVLELLPLIFTQADRRGLRLCEDIIPVMH